MREHWLQHAHGRIVAGDSEPEVLADYGWVQLTDAEREAIEDAIKAVSEELDLMSGEDSFTTATLRNLLERLHA